MCVNVGILAWVTLDSDSCVFDLYLMQLLQLSDDIDGEQTTLAQQPHVLYGGTIGLRGGRLNLEGILGCSSPAHNNVIGRVARVCSDYRQLRSRCVRVCVIVLVCIVSTTIGLGFQVAYNEYVYVQKKFLVNEMEVLEKGRYTKSYVC